MQYYRVLLPRHPAAADSDLSAGAAGVAVAPAAELADAVLVREGFNWLAFFFSVFWAIGNGLWLTALAMIAGLVVLIGVPEMVGLDLASRAILLLGYAIFCGVSGNDWRAAGLAGRGCQLVAVVAARDRAAALIRFAEQGLAASAVPAGGTEDASPPPRPAAIDLGPSPGFWS